MRNVSGPTIWPSRAAARGSFHGFCSISGFSSCGCRCWQCMTQLAEATGQKRKRCAASINTLSRGLVVCIGSATLPLSVGQHTVMCCSLTSHSPPSSAPGTACSDVAGRDWEQCASMVPWHVCCAVVEWGSCLQWWLPCCAHLRPSVQQACVGCTLATALVFQQRFAGSLSDSLWHGLNVQFNQTYTGAG